MELGYDPIYEIALRSNYKDLLNLCKTSKETFGGICGRNGFWKEKTYRDFGDLYDIEEFEGNWWDTYQYYRSAFTLDLIKTIKNQEPLLAEGLLRINEKRQFLMVDGYDDKEDTALIAASYNGYTDIVRILLEEGANPNLAGRYGSTALIWASEGGNADIVRMLLDRKANPNFVSEYGTIALIGASEEGHAAIVKMLLNAKANPDLARDGGATALMWASFQGHADIVEMLLKAGADPDLQNEDRDLQNEYGSTALIVASERGYADIVRMLLNAKANPNLVNGDGNTALILASKKDHTDIVEMLLDAGANPDLANKYGATALMVASDEGHTDIVEILESVKTPVPSGGFFGRLRSGADRTLRYIFDVNTEEDVVGGAGFEPLDYSSELI